MTLLMLIRPAMPREQAAKLIGNCGSLHEQGVRRWPILDVHDVKQRSVSWFCIVQAHAAAMRSQEFQNSSGDGCTLICAQTFPVTGRMCAPRRYDHQCAEQFTCALARGELSLRTIAQRGATRAGAGPRRRGSAQARVRAGASSRRRGSAGPARASVARTGGRNMQPRLNLVS